MSQAKINPRTGRVFSVSYWPAVVRRNGYEMRVIVSRYRYTNGTVVEKVRPATAREGRQNDG